MAKKLNSELSDFLKIGKSVLTATAESLSERPIASPIEVGLEVYNKLNPSPHDQAWEAYENDNFEEALELAKEGEEEFVPFYYYFLCGACHYQLYLQTKKEYFEEAERLGLLDDDADEEDPQWEEITPSWEDVNELREKAYDDLKESLKLREGIDKDSLGHVFSMLEDLLPSSDSIVSLSERRRYAMAAMMCKDLRKINKDLYIEHTQKLLDSFDNCYSGLQEGCYGTEQEIREIKERLQHGCFTGRDYSERQFIYIAKNIDALAGCYDENVQWLFTIDQIPQELKFPVGHPQPNSLYYAHPAKQGEYLPIENADEELFNDKVRDLRRLAQCLGATQIIMKSIKGRSVSEEKTTEFDSELGGSYKGVGGSVGYGNNRKAERTSTEQLQKEIVDRFAPMKYPYLPDDVAWLNVDKEWQNLVKTRLDGNRLHYNTRISSRRTMSANDSRMDEVRLAFQTFVVNANTKFTTKMENSFKREEETIWEFDVTFKPLNEFVDTNNSTAIPSKLNISKDEQEYLDNLKEFLEDDAEITPRERKMLDRIRQSLGISEERAKELEASLKPELTEDEQEYLDNLKEFLEDDAEITPRERKMLDRIRQSLGISEERAKELESSLKPVRDIDKPFSMTVDDVFSIIGRGTVATGRIETGVVKVGDEVLLRSLNEVKRAVVTGVEMFRKILPEGMAGDNVGLLLRGIDKKDVKRGMVITHA